MGKLTKTDAYSVVYGEYDEEKDKELFRCPRETEETSLREYVNSSRDFLGLGQGESIEYIKEIRGISGCILDTADGMAHGLKQVRM